MFYTWQKAGPGYLLMMRNERVAGSFQGRESYAGRTLSCYFGVLSGFNMALLYFAFR